jgi:hypothetical protein
MGCACDLGYDHSMARASTAAARANEKRTCVDGALLFWHVKTDGAAAGTRRRGSCEGFVRFCWCESKSGYFCDWLLLMGKGDYTPPARLGVAAVEGEEGYGLELTGGESSAAVTFCVGG